MKRISRPQLVKADIFSDRLNTIIFHKLVENEIIG